MGSAIDKKRKQVSYFTSIRSVVVRHYLKLLTFLLPPFLSLSLVPFSLVFEKRHTRSIAHTHTHTHTHLYTPISKYLACLLARSLSPAHPPVPVLDRKMAVKVSRRRRRTRPPSILAKQLFGLSFSASSSESQLNHHLVYSSSFRDIHQMAQFHFSSCLARSLAPSRESQQCH